MRVLVILVLSGALGVLGCGTDNEQAAGGAGGSGGSAGAGGTAGGGGLAGGGGMAGGAGMAGGGGMAGGAGMAGGGGMGGDAGAGGSTGVPTAGQFCDDWEAICEYSVGDNFGSRPDCLASYEGFSTPRKECVVTHLGFATDAAPGAERELHCGHASGNPPCGAQ